MAEKKLKRILSLDGGGIRGIMTAQILVGLEDKLNEHYEKVVGQKPTKPVRIGQFFDMVAGTSTGGILTCILLLPDENDPDYPKFSARQALDLYFKNGQSIFKPTISGRLPLFFNGIGGAKYGLQIESVLKEYLGEKKLSDLMRPCLITAYDIEQRCAVFFTSHDVKKNPERDCKLAEVTRSTSAAPTYFMPATAKNASDFVYHNIDGGLFANNPGMCAMIEAMKVFRQSKTKLLEAENMYIVSLGTGIVKKPYSFKEAVSWGILKWVAPIIDILMTSITETVDYQLRKLFDTIKKSSQYRRIMPELGMASPELDDVKPDNLEALRQAALRWIEYNESLLDEIAINLLENGYKTTGELWSEISEEHLGNGTAY